MDLLELLLRKVNRKTVLSPTDKLSLCKKLSNVDVHQGTTIFKLIKNYKNRFDKVNRIGDAGARIPYAGEEVPEIGLIFTAVGMPDELLVVLQEFVKEVKEVAEYDGDEETLMFILKDVKENGKSLEPKIQKFHFKGKKRGMKIETVTDHAGYKVMLAYTGNTNFKPDYKGYYCFWDGQVFDGKPICIPYRYEIKDEIHEFSGPKCFCSIFCMYAYLCDEYEKMQHLRDSRLETATQLTMVAFKLMFPNEDILKPAGRRESIDIFGGPLSIEDYRKQNYEKTYISSNNVFFNEVQTAEFIF